MVKMKKGNYLIRKTAILNQKIMKKNNATVHDVPGVSISVFITDGGGVSNIREYHSGSTTKPPGGCWRKIKNIKPAQTSLFPC